MSEWNYEEYYNEQIKKIDDLKSKGYTDREILDRNEFCFEALKECGLPISYLAPRLLPQQMSLKEWDTHTSCEHKWEYYDETPFGNADERDRVLIGLLYSAGFKHLFDILPTESKEELIEFIKNQILRQIKGSGDDYIRLQESLYKDVPLDELFENASEAWNKKEV